MLLLPQLLLGTFLAFVPDNVLFVGTQIATLAHVLVGVAALPAVVALGFGHALRFRSIRQPFASRTFSVLFAAAVLAASGSGLVDALVYWRGAARVHLIAGLALAVPLALHLLLARRRALGFATLGMLGASLVGIAWARSGKPAEPIEPRSPTFAEEVRPAALYDDSSWCGECHQAEYESWSRSMHARTMDLPTVFNDYVQDPGERGHRVDEAAAVRDGRVHFDGLPSSIRALDACAMCHAPTAYYSDADEPLKRGAPSAGIGCVFCHTLRGTREGHDVGEWLVALGRGKSDFDPESVLSARVDYVSAPETVRRYLFQDSRNAVSHWIGNALIRWRPGMHSRDYSGAFLPKDAACSSCHEFAWTTPTSPISEAFSQSAAQPRVSRAGEEGRPCWRCHMESNDAEPGVSHLFLGGNAKAALQLGDENLGQAEHEYGTKGPTLRIDRATVHDGTLDVTVALRSNLPHAFPTTNGEARVVWVRVFATDPGGGVIADTQSSRVVPEDLIVPAFDRLNPYEERTFAATLAVDQRQPAKVVAELYHSIDAQPIAVVSVDQPAP